MTPAAREILVRGPNWLGDLVMCTPGFRALRAGFPDARITLHVRESLLPVLSGAPWFDALLPVRSYHAGARALLAEGRALRAGGSYDLGICIPDSWSSLLLMRAAGVRRVVGRAGGGRGLLLHDAVRAPGPRRFVPREIVSLALAARVGAPSLGTHLELFTTPADEAAADAALAAAGGGGLDGFLALAPGASFGPSKQWPPDAFARVGDHAARRGLPVVILGAPGEQALVARVAAAMERPAVQLAGRLDPGALKAVIRRARVLVCNDAGARHVAVAFGVPAVVLLGPTSLEKTGCNLERVEVVEESDLPCRPCYQRVCPIDHRCMTRLAPERVIAGVERWLERPPVRQAVGGRRGAENAGS